MPIEDETAAVADAPEKIEQRKEEFSPTKEDRALLQHLVNILTHELEKWRRVVALHEDKRPKDRQRQE